MKCSMNDKGKITIKPVDEVESYALKAWISENNSGDVVVKTDIKNNDMGFKKDSENTK